MAGRIVGEHFNASGQPKRGYSSEHVAKREAARFGKAYYRCEVCNKFHLASPDRPDRERGRTGRPGRE